MKKLLTITVLLIALVMTGCTNTEEVSVVTEETITVTEESAAAVVETEHTRYVTHGRYYINADLDWEIITDDGNIWDYDQDIISDKPRYHTEPVYIGFDDNGTPDDIYDDIVLGMVLDIETAIYDELEDSLSESFELERDGNNIRIQGFTNVREQQLKEVE